MTLRILTVTLSALVRAGLVVPLIHATQRPTEGVPEANTRGIASELLQAKLLLKRQQSRPNRRAPIKAALQEIGW